MCLISSIWWGKTSEVIVARHIFVVVGHPKFDIVWQVTQSWHALYDIWRICLMHLNASTKLLWEHCGPEMPQFCQISNLCHGIPHSLLGSLPIFSFFISHVVTFTCQQGKSHKLADSEVKSGTCKKTTVENDMFERNAC